MRCLAFIPKFDEEPEPLAFSDDKGFERNEVLNCLVVQYS